VQEFIVAFWEKRIYERMTPINFRGFLFTSVKNQALKYLEKRDPLSATHAIGGALVESLAQVEPEDITEEMIGAVEAEIEKLPPRTREVLRAVYVDGLRYKDVAAKFGITIATVKTLLVKALKRLREIFSNRY
jgi:RNA polymerase sigma-70 factor (ECF subfamily)